MSSLNKPFLTYTGIVSFDFIDNSTSIPSASLSISFEKISIITLHTSLLFGQGIFPLSSVTLVRKLFSGKTKFLLLPMLYL